MTTVSTFAEHFRCNTD